MCSPFGQAEVRSSSQVRVFLMSSDENVTAVVHAALTTFNSNRACGENSNKMSPYIRS